jgi:hypothetical protein
MCRKRQCPIPAAVIAPLHFNPIPTAPAPWKLFGTFETSRAERHKVR